MHYEISLVLLSVRGSTDSALLVENGSWLNQWQKKSKTIFLLNNKKLKDYDEEHEWKLFILENCSLHKYLNKI